MTDEEFLGYMNGFLNDYYGAAAPYLMEYIRATVEASLTPGLDRNNGNLAEYSGCTAVYVRMSVFMNAYKKTGERDEEMTRAMPERWKKAEAADLTEEQATRLERASIHFYKWCKSFLPSERRLGRKYMDLKEEYRIRE